MINNVVVTNKIFKSFKMHCYINFIVAVLIICNIGSVCCVRMLKLSVPPVADLQDNEVTLDCSYDMGNEELYSVKWYKDELEFFRYLPRGGGTLSFPVPGVTVLGEGSIVPLCDSKHCPVVLTKLSKSTEGSYRCEVSTEAPTFRLFFDTANMSVVAMPRGKVQITTPQTEYLDGDEIRVNCTSPPADPPPRIQWFVNDKLLDPSAIISQSDSAPDDRGLITRSLAAHLTATKVLFLQNNGVLELRCEVNAYLQKIPIHSTVQMSLIELREQKFDWLSSTGTPMIIPTASTLNLLYCTTLLFHKYIL